MGAVGGVGPRVFRGGCMVAEAREGKGEVASCEPWCRLGWL